VGANGDVRQGSRCGREGGGDGMGYHTTHTVVARPAGPTVGRHVGRLEVDVGGI
jgi:hypothetical protein